MDVFASVFLHYGVEFFPSLVDLLGELFIHSKMRSFKFPSFAFDEEFVLEMLEFGNNGSMFIACGRLPKAVDSMKGDIVNGVRGYF